MTRILKRDWMILDFLVCVWAITAAFGIVYLLARPKRPDVFLHGVACIAAGLTGSAALCVLLWIILGGWGPPSPLFFGVVGHVAGLVLGAATYPRNVT